MNWLRIIAVLSMVVTGLLTIGVSVIFAWWTGKLAVSRGRRKEWGWIVGSWTGIIGVIVYACLPDRDLTYTRVAA